MALQPLLFDTTWAQQWKFENAEAHYQQVLSGQSAPGAQSQAPNISQGSNLKSEIAQARQNIQKALNEGASQAGDGAVDQQVLNRVKSLEQENKSLKKASEDLTALLKKLELRVTSLEKSGGGSKAAPTPAPAAADDDDSDFDPFGDDDSESEDEETKQRLAEYHAKKAKKTAIIAKSSLLIDIKPWDDETDMKELERLIRTIVMQGLIWGQGKLIPVGYGIKKLQINAVIEDSVSTDELEDKVCAFEDLVQSMDIAAFNKI